MVIEPHPSAVADLTDAKGRALLAALKSLDDVPRLRSTHPGGFVLSCEPLGTYMPIEHTTMGRTIIQFDKDDLDAAGVPKFDFLGNSQFSPPSPRDETIRGAALHLTQLIEEVLTLSRAESGGERLHAALGEGVAGVPRRPAVVPKPEPDLVNAALKKAGTDSGVMVGDTTWCMYSVYSNALDISENAGVSGILKPP